MIYYKELFESLRTTNDGSNNTESIAIAAVEASFQSQATAIVVITTSGKSAQAIAKYRPACPIIAVTRNPVAGRQAHLWRGIFPIMVKTPKPEGVNTGEAWMADVDSRIKVAMDQCEALGIVHKGGNLVVVTGWRGGSGYTNTMRIVQCE